MSFNSVIFAEKQKKCSVKEPRLAWSVAYPSASRGYLARIGGNEQEKRSAPGRRKQDRLSSGWGSWGLLDFEVDDLLTGPDLGPQRCLCDARVARRHSRLVSRRLRRFLQMLGNLQRQPRCVLRRGRAPQPPCAGFEVED